ncbi:IS66-like element accessory protein TnpA [Prosthecomicrobium sp. N25]|uniref:IS66-like element accessory protein TnpA n=1 Tax=Prosthecomicrobium sp. N25 TaxID=3129254 RepID=UPI003077EE6D
MSISEHKHVSKDDDGPVRRFEGFNGAGRRRTVEEKTAIVAETLGGAETVSEVARRHDICPSLVFTWRRQAREGRLGSVRDAPPLLPVTIEGDGAATACGSDRSRRATRLIEIDLGRGRRVRVDRDVDADALRLVLDVLGGR